MNLILIRTPDGFRPRRNFCAPQLRMEEFALAAPGRGQIRVRVRAAAANPMDWKIRSSGMKLMTGRKFPRGLGHDFAGVVEEVGPKVTRFKVGDEVFGATGLKEAGTFAEALVTADKTVFLKPRSLSFKEAAALPIVGAATWTALIDKAKLREPASGSSSRAVLGEPGVKVEGGISGIWKGPFALYASARAPSGSMRVLCPVGHQLNSRTPWAFIVALV